MYKQFKKNLESVEDVLQRSFSNLSVTDVRPSLIAEKKVKVKSVIESAQFNDDLVDSDMHKKIQECWKSINAQCLKYKGVQSGSAEEEIGWRTVRVFVSSTFTDFFCEREVLVKKVFPELREWCQQRMLYLVDCDMRWGVPKDSTTTDTIIACMEELDRCMEESAGEPFFLNMIGERYGWIPDVNDLPTEVKDKYHWVPDTSITFMEILHGAYRSQNPNALFMFRDDSIISDIKEALLPRYKDQDELSIGHLKHLKQMLCSRFPDQVKNYMCKTDGIVTKHDKEIANIVDLDDFSDMVLTFFKNAITRQYPNRHESMDQDSTVLVEGIDQKKIMEELADSMVGRKTETDSVKAYLHGDTSHLTLIEKTSPFSRDPNYWSEFVSLPNYLLHVQGHPGYGKTTLLAKITQNLIKDGKDVFYHFCGSTSQSHNCSLLLQRLVTFLTKDQTKEYLEYLNELEDGALMDIIKNELQKSSTCGQHLVLIFDGLDQLSTYESVNHLSWLPPTFPETIHCIVSSSYHPPTVSRIQEHGNFMVTLEPLIADEARQIVERSLGRFNKKLDNDQISLILNSKCCQSPLWLYLVCEELRIYGDFRTLTKQIQSVTTSVDDMVVAILNRLVGEDDTGNMEKTLGILACVHGVLTALDLQRMLGNISQKEPLPLLVWSRIRRNLQAYLRISNYNDQIMTMHNNIKIAIKSSVIKTDKETVKYHTLLADYIQYWSEDRTLRTVDLPYHLEAAHLKERMVMYLRKIPESGRIPSFIRSAYMTKCRCSHLADPVINGVVPVYICQFCKNSRAMFNPSGYPSNADMCMVCGNQAFANTHSTTSAYLCQFHAMSFRMTHLLTCFLCRNIIPNKQSVVPGQLCSNCGFGHHKSQCAGLDMSLRI